MDGSVLEIVKCKCGSRDESINRKWTKLAIPVCLKVEGS